MRTTRRDGVSGIVIGPIAIPLSFLWTLGGLVGAGWMGFCMVWDIAFDGGGRGAALFFFPLLGIGGAVGLVALVSMLVKQFRTMNRGPE